MNKRVELQSRDETTVNDLNEVTGSWSTQTTVWASIKPMNGKELFRAEQVKSSARTKITIRYYSSIDETWRVKYGTRIYDIEWIDNIDERNRVMEIFATEHK